ncbi:hypothetical protein AMTRI_Chr12g273980 [Amborella trichopoda]|uniref:Uncharacterized protein n=1 Tax=Amborella trichopoda TaxID=13333 RepID=W1PBA8_AMBTC|nr:uncharacterized protein LOC18435394 [Amborella trichopoda]ERN07177.1 hypothetical protein AMTR_s00019p00155840 [Amborella trichopoda]|eukprot:XP_006845502.1 uncharacterized protein LOC18435394 [Amborella trichopoda]
MQAPSTLNSHCKLELPGVGFHPVHLKLQVQPWKIYRSSKLQRMNVNGRTRGIGVFNGGKVSAWDEKPYDLSQSGRKVFLDELDIVTLVDSPKELIPLDPDSYNPAAYLWKKIADIPEERRHRLLRLLKSRHISRLWEMAGTRYGDSKLVKKSASDLLSFEKNSEVLEYWSCKTTGVPLRFAWANDFKKAVFRDNDGDVCGRIFPGGSFLAKIADSFSPLYFTVKNIKEVMATEQPCDLAYEFGDGLLNLSKYPEGFPMPAKHPWPFSDHMVIYVRHMGPGILVGQAWQEGEKLEQVPKKFCGEILMVKYYNGHVGDSLED